MAGTNLIKASDKRIKRRGSGDVAERAADTALLEFQSPTAALIAEPVPFTARMTTWIIAAMFVSTCIAMSLLPMDQVIVARGTVVARDATLIVQPLETSILRGINVRDGQVVRAGDVIAELDPTFSGSDEKSTSEQAASLQAEVNRLTAELDGRDYTPDTSQFGQIQALLFAQRHGDFTAHVEQFSQQVESLRAKVQQAQNDVVSFGTRLPGARKLEEMRIQLEKQQVGSKINTLAATDSRMQLEGQLADAQAALAGAQRDLAAMVAQRDQYIQSWRSDTSQQLTTQGRLLADMRDQSDKNKLRSKLVDLRAEKDGVVLNVAKVSVGAVLQPGQTIVTIVPNDAQLEVEAFVAGRDEGYVKAGDPVSIKFDSYNYTRHGMATGEVRTLSSDSFINPQFANSSTTSQSPLMAETDNSEDPLGMVFYRVRATMDRVKLYGIPPGVKILPGMPVSAEIKVGDRTMMEYILGRIIPAFSTGMREPM